MYRSSRSSWLARSFGIYVELGFAAIKGPNVSGGEGRIDDRVRFVVGGARVHIGRNWGSPMTQKDEPELVTSGPYQVVRHPIYSGLLAAGIGTAVALSWIWLIAVALAGVYFVYSATVEERHLSEQFPDTYPAYKSKTKMLLPFIV